VGTDYGFPRRSLRRVSRWGDYLTTMTRAEEKHMERVASAGCVVCRRLGHGYSPAQVHHVAEGSGLRSNYAVAGLCETHHDPHRTGSGFHGMGTKRFCSMFRVPGETEWGLLAWVNEDMAKYS
jgi:hypothetical protein